ncbi:MAG TPA: GNAT family N-acetyltransferase [bacterium]|nr:GNAT family N-acetyltransferase [bacterium]
MPATIERRELSSSLAQALIATLNRELSAQYPEEGANHFRLDREEVAEGRGAFFVVFVDSEPVGCGAVRLIDGDTAELKRMFIARDARGKGLGRALLIELENEARRLGASRLVLETGPRQDAALAMYQSAGFREIPPFGEYVGAPMSLCFGKDLER